MAAPRNSIEVRVHWRTTVPSPRQSALWAKFWSHLLGEAKPHMLQRQDALLPWAEESTGDMEMGRDSAICPRNDESLEVATSRLSNDGCAIPLDPEEVSREL
jgi:hypothetical protein